MEEFFFQELFLVFSFIDPVLQYYREDLIIALQCCEGNINDLGKLMLETSCWKEKIK